jgi:hypothetical protein
MRPPPPEQFEVAYGLDVSGDADPFGVQLICACAGVTTRNGRDKAKPAAAASLASRVTERIENLDLSVCTIAS